MPKESKALDITALIVSILALTASVFSPFITYQWLQNDVRIQRMKANSLRVKYKTASSIGDREDSPKGVIVHDINVSNTVRIRNEGALPVGQVEAIFECDNETTNPFADTVVHSVPPRQIKKTIDGNSMFMVFESPLAPGEEVDLIIEQTIKVLADKEPAFSHDKAQLWIKSEASPPIQILPLEEMPATSDASK